MNVGRGTIIDEASLVNALEKNWIRGAVLGNIEISCNFKMYLRKSLFLWKASFGRCPMYL